MATTIRELVASPPRMSAGSTDADDWSHSRCDNHDKCLKGMVSQWRIVARKLGTVVHTSTTFSLQYDLGDALKEYKFERMDPRCREALIKELSARADSFHHRIVQAATTKLLALAGY